MPGENEERVLFGMDAEHAEKMKQKLLNDPKYERDALNWIETLTGEKLTDTYTSLKSGVVLCKLINVIKPGTIKFINVKPIAICERENLKSYIMACEILGVPKEESFTVSDLHDKKSINAVLLNIYSLGRAVQTIEGFSGPMLGVRYSVTIEDQKRREEAKELARKREQEQYEEYEQERKKRREFLEEEKTTRRLKREDTYNERVKTRRIKKGRRVSNSHRKSGGFGGISPVKFGMDHEHQKAMEERQMEVDAEYEETALDWIEEMTGIELDDIYRSLKSGVVLCQLANVIEPGVIPKIHTKNLAAVHRENIQLYLNACVKWGIPTHELFTVPDLYERKMISSVVVNIYALARFVNTKMHTRLSAPTLLARGGKSVVISRKDPGDSGNENSAILNPKEPSLRNISNQGSSKRLSRSGAPPNEATPLVVPDEPTKRSCCSCTIM